MRRHQNARLLRRDWIGDGIVTLLVGVVLLITVFLPWANEEVRGDVNYSLTMPDGINGILQTPWGTRELLLAIAVVCLGAVVTLTRPRRFSWVSGLLIAVCGAAVLLVGRDAAAGLVWFSPGLGMYLNVLAGVLLLPIGLATALVGWFVARAQAAAAAEAGAAVTSGQPAPVPTGSTGPPAPPGPPAP